MAQQTQFNSRRWWWVSAWAVFTLTGVVIHELAWVPPDRLEAGLCGIAEWPPVKAASNAVDVGVGPVWLAMALAVGDWGVYSLAQTVIANAVAAALVLGVCHRLLRLRRWIDERLQRSPVPVNSARRRFLVESPLAVAGMAVAGPTAVGALVEPFDLRLRRHRVPIRDLPTSLDGYRAAFISDTHLGPRIAASYIKRVVSEAMALRPDVFLLGGDYVHAGTRYVRPAVDLFRPLVRSGVPVVAVLGNHDWYNSSGLIGALMRDAGIRMVDNSRVFVSGTTRGLTDEPTDECLCLAGVGDAMMDRVALVEALEGVPAHTPRIVLSHNPDVAEYDSVRAERVDLMLCGHTHGGQIRLPLLGPMYVPCRFGVKYEGGLVQGPGCPVLTSRGVGMSICPVRIGVPPELIEITLVRDSSRS